MTKRSRARCAEPEQEAAAHDDDYEEARRDFLCAAPVAPGALLAEERAAVARDGALRTMIEAYLSPELGAGGTVWDVVFVARPEREADAEFGDRPWPLLASDGEAAPAFLLALRAVEGALPGTLRLGFPPWRPPTDTELDQRRKFALGYRSERGVAWALHNGRDGAPLAWPDAALRALRTRPAALAGDDATFGARLAAERRLREAGAFDPATGEPLPDREAGGALWPAAPPVGRLGHDWTLCAASSRQLASAYFAGAALRFSPAPNAGEQPALTLERVGARLRARVPMPYSVTGHADPCLSVCLVGSDGVAWCVTLADGEPVPLDASTAPRFWIDPVPSSRNDALPFSSRLGADLRLLRRDESE